jgi:hypothetical protein
VEHVQIDGEKLRYDNSTPIKIAIHHGARRGTENRWREYVD